MLKLLTAIFVVVTVVVIVFVCICRIRYTTKHKIHLITFGNGQYARGVQAFVRKPTG